MINTEKNHQHIYDAKGKMICCSLEEKINSKTQSHYDDDHDEHGHSHQNDELSIWKQYIPALISSILLITGLVFDNLTKPDFFENQIRFIWYLIAYIPVGLPVIKDAVKSISKGALFSEFFLMSIATLGAFLIGEYSEGVAVMLFYAVGELLQTAAVNKAKRSIKALLDIRPDTVNVIRNGYIKTLSPAEIAVDEVIQVRAGEKVALDGEMLSASAAFNTSALTGESKPDTKNKGEKVFAGMINLNSVADIKVTTLFKDSKLSRILELAQKASTRKAPTQLFISRFSEIYTPVVVFLAVGICFFPAIFVDDYVFSEWLYRSLVFLVISCPCALVISIPLGYFGGIGLASKNGILFKGSNYLDVMTKIDTVVMDKTGTLTKGVFKVQKVEAVGIDEKELLQLTAGIESKSTHPIAVAITQHVQDNTVLVGDIEEIAGHGLKGKINGKEVLAGNTKLLKKFNIAYDTLIENIVESIVVVAINNTYAGYITVSDEIKDDAEKAITDMHNLKLHIIMLSGDKQSVVNTVAKKLNIVNAFGNLLPEDKVNKVQQLKNEGRIVAFVGDGVNDAPVIALADAGIAMGGLGSDAAIETADIVIQNDMPSKIVTAIKIGKLTKQIVTQNIVLAMSVKAIVLIMGTGGIATLWEAVFADVGVALLAILNAVRIQNWRPKK